MKRSGFFLLFVFISISIVSAHPHMWIDGFVSPVLESNRLVALDVRWEFDEFSASSMILSFDLDRNNWFNPSEQEDIRINGFEHLKEYNYFTLLMQGTREIEITRIENFYASVDQGKLIYEFRAYFATSLGLNREVALMFMDPSYYVAFDTTSTAVVNLNNTQSNISIEKQLSLVDMDTWGVVEAYVLYLKQRS
jgi:ABC-type uncharacterized transport system substrate-binding protein